MTRVKNQKIGFDIEPWVFSISLEISKNSTFLNILFFFFGLKEQKICGGKIKECI